MFVEIKRLRTKLQRSLRCVYLGIFFNDYWHFFFFWLPVITTSSLNGPPRLEGTAGHSQDRCQDTEVPLSKASDLQMLGQGPAMSWPLLQGCMAGCSRDRLQPPPHDPVRDKGVKRKRKKAKAPRLPVNEPTSRPPFTGVSGPEDALAFTMAPSQGQTSPRAIYSQQLTRPAYRWRVRPAPDWSVTRRLSARGSYMDR